MTEREIFIAALHKSEPAKRADFLNRACGEDQAMRDEIEELLHEQEKLGSFLEERAGRALGTGSLLTDFEGPLAERPGTVIGTYKLMELVGEGGMGLVFVAEQQHPVRRTVALKVIKPGMDTRRIVARFEAERQALALMDHPNIARVLDGGETASGRPYFVWNWSRACRLLSSAMTTGSIPASVCSCLSPCATLSSTPTRRGSSTAT
jgi:serine/threonine protein kinase